MKQAEKLRIKALIEETRRRTSRYSETFDLLQEGEEYADLVFSAMVDMEDDLYRFADALERIMEEAETE